MKKFTLLAIIAAFSLTVSANEVKPSSEPAGIYMMMKNGKLIQVNHGRRKIIRKDVTLANETTIHPNGAIDVYSGQSTHLKEGEYMTMDGRIRKLKKPARRKK